MPSKAADGLGLLIGIGPSKGSKSGKGAESAPEEDSDEKTLAAEGILRAVKRNDADALSRALEQHYECCMDAHTPKAEKADDEEPEEDDEY